MIAATSPRLAGAILTSILPVFDTASATFGRLPVCCKKILHDSSHMACIDGVTQIYSWATQSATQTMPAKSSFVRICAIPAAL